MNPAVGRGNRKVLQVGYNQDDGLEEEDALGSAKATLVVIPEPSAGPVTRTCRKSCSLKGHQNGHPVKVFSNSNEFCIITKNEDNSCVVVTKLRGAANTFTGNLFLTGCVELTCL